MSSMAAIPRCWKCGTGCWKCGTVYDAPERVRVIAGCFIPHPPEVVVEELVDEKYDSEWKEGLLNELQSYVRDSIDVTSVLHSEGLLVPFLHHVLSNKHACIREKAAELITTMVKNNPKNQQLVIEGNGLQPLLYNFSSDPDVTSKTQALVAMSALIRGNKSGGITAFQRENGYAALRNTLISESVCQRSAIYREVVYLLDYLLCENSLYLHAMDLQLPDGSEVQEAALSGILLLAERKGENSGQLVKNDDKPKQVLLQELPSAALPTVQTKKKKKKKQFKLEENEAPLTLGLGPSSAATPTVQGNSSSTTNGQSNPSVSLS